jgi:hypothetical protein
MTRASRRLQQQFDVGSAPNRQRHAPAHSDVDLSPTICPTTTTNLPTVRSMEGGCQAVRASNNVRRRRRRRVTSHITPACNITHATQRLTRADPSFPSACPPHSCSNARYILRKHRVTSRKHGAGLAIEILGGSKPGSAGTVRQTRTANDTGKDMTESRAD